MDLKSFIFSGPRSRPQPGPKPDHLLKGRLTSGARRIGGGGSAPAPRAAWAGDVGGGGGSGGEADKCMPPTAAAGQKTSNTGKHNCHPGIAAFNC